MARRLGDMLIEDGLITPTQRDEALRVQKSYGGRIGTNLVQLGAIELEALALALSRQKGVPAAQQRHFESIHPEAVALLPAQLAQKHSAIPLGFTARHPKTIGVALMDPSKPGVVDEIQRAVGARVYPVIAPELRIVHYLEKLYGIPRHPRFLQLDGDGEVPQRHAQGAEVGDPRSFFDMSRPDLSQPRSSSVILLTDELRVQEAASPARPSDRSPPAAPARAPEPGTRERAPESASPASRSQVAIGTPAQFARPALPSIAAASRSSTAPAEARATHGRVNPPPSVAPAGVTWPRTTLEPTPPPLPTPAALPRPDSTAPVASQVPQSAASKAKPTPAFFRRPPEVLHRHGEASEASSRAPTIPGLPSFSDGEQTATKESETPSASAERARSGSVATAKVEPSAAASAKVAFPIDEQAAAKSGGSAAVSIWSPNWRASQGAQSASKTEPTPESADARLKLATRSTVPPVDLDAALAATPVDFGPDLTAAPVDLDEALAAAPVDLGADLTAAPVDLNEALAAAPVDLGPGLPAASIDLGPDLAETPLASAPTAVEEPLERASAPAAQTAEAAQPPTPAASPRPWSATEAVDALAVASNRDQVADAIANYLRSSCGVGLVLMVQHEVAMGWRGFAPGIADEEIDALAIPLAAPSALQVAYEEQRIYQGPPSWDAGALDVQLFERLRVAPPKEVIVAPVLIRDRVVNLIFAHAADGGPLPDRVSIGLGTLTRSASAAYVRLIQEAKKRAPS